MKQGILIILLVAFVWGDVVMDYAQVRNERELGFLRIDYGMLFTPEVYQFAIENRDSLNAEGFFIADTAMSHTRSDTVGMYQITTKIDFYAPRGSGFGGGSWTSNITITINSVEMVNIPFGHLSSWDHLHVKSVRIQSNGYLKIDAVSGYPQREINLSAWFKHEKELNKKIDSDMIHKLMMKNQTKNLTEKMNQEKLDSLLAIAESVSAGGKASAK